MKKIMSLVFACMVLVGMVGCGKVLGELRADGDAVIDTTTGAVTQTVTTVGTVAKKLVSIGFAVYDLVKKAGEDSKDNFNTVKGAVTGGMSGATAPSAPTK